MLKLFRDEEPGQFRYTEEANRFDAEVHAVISPVLERWREKGYSPRELGYLAWLAINDISITQVLDAYAAEANRRKENGNVQAR